MVNRKKRLFFLTAAAVLCLIAASCGSASDGFDGRMEEPSITLLLKNNLPDESITTKAVEWFSEHSIEQETDLLALMERLNLIVGGRFKRAAVVLFGKNVLPEN